MLPSPTALLSADRVLLDLSADDEAVAIRAVAGIFRRASGSYRPRQAGRPRSSTASGSARRPSASGVAFPHARTALVKEIVVAAGRSVDGRAVRREPEEPVHFIFVIGTPPDRAAQYLALVGTLARLLRGDDRPPESSSPRRRRTISWRFSAPPRRRAGHRAHGCTPRPPHRTMAAAPAEGPHLAGGVRPPQPASDHPASGQGSSASWPGPRRSAFRKLTDLIHLLLTGHKLDYVETFQRLPDWQRLVTPAAGGALAGLTLLLGARLNRRKSSAPTTWKPSCSAAGSYPRAPAS